VALALIKQLGPVLSVLMVTGRVGSAVTTKIGIMRISEQIDALELMGLNPFSHSSYYCKSHIDKPASFLSHEDNC